jgi:hypothetical protein
MNGQDMICQASRHGRTAMLECPIRLLASQSAMIVVRPKSWTLGIINSGGPIKERINEKTPQVHT